jgi:hypothetical protein
MPGNNRNWWRAEKLRQLESGTRAVGFPGLQGGGAHVPGGVGAGQLRCRPHAGVQVAGNGFSAPYSGMIYEAN